MGGKSDKTLFIGVFLQTRTRNKGFKQLGVCLQKPQQPLNVKVNMTTNNIIQPYLRESNSLVNLQIGIWYLYSYAFYVITLVFCGERDCI